MTVRNPRTWSKWLLPKTKHVKWTWKRWLLLAFAIYMLIDSFLVPFYGNIDPGGYGAGMLALILGTRASSNSKLPVSVVVAGGFAAALTWGLNHRFLKSSSAVWTGLVIFFVLFVVFWGRGKSEQAEAAANLATPDQSSVLRLDNENH